MFNPKLVRETVLDYKDFQETDIFQLREKDKELLSKIILTQDVCSDKCNKQGHFHFRTRRCRDEIYRRTNLMGKNYSVSGNCVILAQFRTPNIISSIPDIAKGLIINCELLEENNKKIEGQYQAINESSLSTDKFFDTVNQDVKEVIKQTPGCYSYIDFDLMANFTSEEESFSWGKLGATGSDTQGKSIVSITTGIGRSPRSTKELYEKKYYPSFVDGISTTRNILYLERYKYRDPKSLDGPNVGVYQHVIVCVTEPKKFVLAG